MSQPVYTYISRCCNKTADKEPCALTRDEKKEHEYGEHSLGTWNCTGCGKKCSVTRTKNDNK